MATQMTSAQIRDLFQPFFEATRAATDNARGNYDCVFCHKPVANNETAGRSFTTDMPRWAHVDCLRKVPGASLNTDKRAKAKAAEAAKERWTALRKAQRDAAQPTIDKDTLRAEIEAELRVKIDAEYAETIQQAVDLIRSLREQVKTLTETNALMEQAGKEATAGACEARRQRRRAALVDTSK